MEPSAATPPCVSGSGLSPLPEKIECGCGREHWLDRAFIWLKCACGVLLIIDLDYYPDADFAARMPDDPKQGEGK